MGKMATKGGHEHDDNNGPAATTCWQNLGVAASQARLQLVVVVHGHDVVLEAPKGQMALFQAWLPHLTRNAPDVGQTKGARGDWRVHHTAYARRDTEYFGWVACACRDAGVGIVSHAIGGELGSDSRALSQTGLTLSQTGQRTQICAAEYYDLDNHYPRHVKV